MRMKWGKAALAVSTVFAALAPLRVAADDGTLNVVATTFPVHMITAAVVADDPGVKLDMLLSPSLGCPHNYVMTPADMRRASAADIIVTNGLGLDDFIDDLVKDRKNDGPLVVESSRGLNGIMEYTWGTHDKPGHAGHREKSGHDGHKGHSGHAGGGAHSHEGVNPHIFASPMMAASMALNIARQLGAIRPSMAAHYQANATAFMTRMTILDAEFKVAVSRLKNRRIVTQHGAFDYLARDVGLEIVTVILSHPGTEPSASEMINLVRIMKTTGAGAVFAEPQFNSRMAATVAREAGVPMDVLDPVATGPAGATPDYYEKTMRANIVVLEKTLGTR